MLAATELNPNNHSQPRVEAKNGIGLTAYDPEFAKQVETNMCFRFLLFR